MTICPLDDADQVAQYVAFATSVRRHGSSLDAIARIGEALGAATRDESTIRSISAPLLGAGAGGLDPGAAVAQLRIGFMKRAAPDAVLSVFVIREADYASLAALFRHEATDPALPHSESVTRSESWPDIHGRQRDVTAFGTAPPRVFISHSALSETRKAWLEDLYRYLRQNGINARLDKHALRPGMDVLQWMTNELRQADRVLLICDERYAERADGRHGGVGWETMMIQGDLYTSMYRAGASEADAGSKYIPIVLTSDVRAGTPDYLATKMVLHWPPDADEQRERARLLEELFGETEDIPVGPRPDLERGAVHH